MLVKFETNYGNFYLEEIFVEEENITFYEVYDEPKENELLGYYIGEFTPLTPYDKNMSAVEKETFITELELFIEEWY